MNDIRRMPTEQWEALLGVRLLPPVLRFDPERDRPALPSASACWQDMCALDESHRDVDVAPSSGWPDTWTVTYRHRGVERTVSVRDVEPVDLLTADPIRTGTWHRNSTARAGMHFFASTGEHIYHDSLFERDLLILLDFDGTVSALASQPFRLGWTEGGSLVHHTPDFAAVLDGVMWIINVRPTTRMNLALRRNAAALNVVCALHGWNTAVVTDYARPALTVVTTVAAAKKTADPYAFDTAILDTLRSGPRTFGELAQATSAPAVARAVLQRLIWDRRVTIDLNRVLTDSTLVSLGDDSSTTLPLTRPARRTAIWQDGETRP